MALPDPARSRAVLIGVSEYHKLAPLPAVANNLRRLAGLLCEPAGWGLPREHCVVIANPASAERTLDALEETVALASDTLLVYYAGHGLIRDGTYDLHLALPEGHPGRLRRTLPYKELRRIVAAAHRCPAKVVILDCCYSGLAMADAMGGATRVADHMRIDGTYLMTATAALALAHAPAGEVYTAFTGEIIRVLEIGIPDGPELLDTDAVFWAVHHELEAKDRPIPQQQNSNNGRSIILGRNRLLAAPDAEPVEATASTDLQRHEEAKTSRPPDDPSDDGENRQAIGNRSSRRRFLVGSGSVALLTVGGLALWWPFSGDPPKPSTGDLIRTIKGHAAWVWFLTFSPDGRHLATANADRTVCIWQVETGDLIRTLSGHSDVVWSVAYSRDGKQLATASADRTVCIWQVETGGLIRTLTGHTDNVWSVAYSPDGEQLATASADKTARVWHADTGETVHTLTGHTDCVTQVAYQPGTTSRVLATASWDGTTTIWNIDNGVPLQTLYGPNEKKVFLRYARNGTKLAIGSINGYVSVHQADAAYALDKDYDYLGAHTGAVSGIDFSPDMNRIVTAGVDGVVRLWQKGNNRLVAAIPGNGSLGSVVTYTVDGGYLFVSGDLVRVYKA